MNRRTIPEFAEELVRIVVVQIVFGGNPVIGPDDLVNFLQFENTREKEHQDATLTSRAAGERFVNIEDYKIRFYDCLKRFHELLLKVNDGNPATSGWEVQLNHPLRATYLSPNEYASLTARAAKPLLCMAKVGPKIELRPIRRIALDWVIGDQDRQVDSQTILDYVARSHVWHGTDPELLDKLFLLLDPPD